MRGSREMLALDDAPLRHRLRWAGRLLWFRVFPPPPARFTAGDRVHAQGEGVGHVEKVESWHDGGMGWRYEVRWLTPDNEPSACLTFGIGEDRLCKVSENVLPQPRSAAWKREAAEFGAVVEAALERI